MYIPPLFVESDPEQIRAQVRSAPFATLVTSGALGLIATHVPLVLTERDTLIGHLARANPQVDELGGTVLAIFHGPHAFVSSGWYGEPARHVPTWNYVAVHATGTSRVLEDPMPALDALMEALQPADRVPSGDAARDRYLERLAAGIVAFEIAVTRWEGKAKLSQNRDPEDQRRVREVLSASDDPGARAVAARMRAP